MESDEKDGFIAVLGCNRCGRCDNICPTFALHTENGLVKIDHERCTLCMKCVNICPYQALVYME
ncbi:MAG: 4Fe-4S binding protein [Euryarchaeota archaeon]|nr:4Fe-4S binding protein [Euryarchaeota archaeon]